MKKKITLVRKIRYVESYTYNLVKAREVLYEESLSHTLETRRVEIPTKGSRERRDETRRERTSPNGLFTTRNSYTCEGSTNVLIASPQRGIALIEFSTASRICSFIFRARGILTIVKLKSPRINLPNVIVQCAVYVSSVSIKLLLFSSYKYLSFPPVKAIFMLIKFVLLITGFKSFNFILTDPCKLSAKFW